MKILNLTQHMATPEQVVMGVFEPENKTRIQELLTFNSLPTREEINDRAMAIASYAGCQTDCTHAMIGGAPYLMPALEHALTFQGITPLYSFTERVSVETVQPDGTVKKTAVFKHIGFVALNLDPYDFGV